jgi:hypothetical protein
MTGPDRKSPQSRPRIVHNGADLAVDEGLHVSDEVVREPDLELGGGLEPGQQFGGQCDIQGAEVVAELIEGTSSA